MFHLVSALAEASVSSLKYPISTKKEVAIMVATQLHSATTPTTSDAVVDVELEGVKPLDDPLRVRLRQAICAAGPQADCSVFEAIARFFFSVQKIHDEIPKLHQRFQEARNNTEEFQIVDELVRCREVLKSINLQPEQVLSFEQHLDTGDDAAARARKLVAELLDKHLLVEKDGHVCPNIPVKEVKLTHHS